MEGDIPVTPHDIMYELRETRGRIMENLGKYPQNARVLLELSYCSPGMPQELKKRLGIPVHEDMGISEANGV